MPAQFDPAPLVRAIRLKMGESGKNTSTTLHEISQVTGISYRQLQEVISCKDQIAERTVDKICCKYLNCHPCFIYGDYYFGDRLEYFLAQQDAIYGTNISKYCEHDWEIVSYEELLKLDRDHPGMVVIRREEVILVHCKKCEGYSHGVVKKQSKGLLSGRHGIGHNSTPKRFSMA